MEVRLSLSLPRDARYVAVLREIARGLLSDIDVPPEAAADVTLALTEACANAVRHAAGVEQYSVSLAIDDTGCEIEVIDLGPGFELEVRDLDAAHESGRGIRLMRALVDALHFHRDREGMRVRLVKRWDRLWPDPWGGDDIEGRGGHQNAARGSHELEGQGGHQHAARGRLAADA